MQPAILLCKVLCPAIAAAKRAVDAYSSFYYLSVVATKKARQSERTGMDKLELMKLTNHEAADSRSTGTKFDLSWGVSKLKFLGIGDAKQR